MKALNPLAEGRDFTSERGSARRRGLSLSSFAATLPIQAALEADWTTNQRIAVLAQADGDLGLRAVEHELAGDASG